jgi:hypothetical protein
LIRAGQRNIVRLNDWSEQIDKTVSKRDVLFEQLSKRLTDLEEEVRKLKEGRQ